MFYLHIIDAIHFSKKDILKFKIMVNPESPTFKFFEKVGLVIAKILRVTVVGEIAVFLGKKLIGSDGPKPPQSVPNPAPTT